MTKWMNLLKQWMKRWMLPTRSKNVTPPMLPESDRTSPTVRRMMNRLRLFLSTRYTFRFNELTAQVEYREREAESPSFLPLSRRALNTLCLQAQLEGIPCWDKDVKRLVESQFVPAYHPFLHYMTSLPVWDGTDRVSALAQRISADPLWVSGFHTWMLGMAAQWEGVAPQYANALAPLLVSTRQGMGKSTFCRMLMPAELACYYLDKFDINAKGCNEQRLATLGLINMDEFDRYTPASMAALKNLMQLTTLYFRRAYADSASHLPRLASFIGTSNRFDLLTDLTGSRRFLCQEVKTEIDCTPPDHAQLFAQLHTELQNGKRHWLTKTEEQNWEKHNRRFYRHNAEQEVFFHCFRLPQEGEAGEWLSATQLFNHLCRLHPAAMRGVTMTRFGRTLITLGVERANKRDCHCYRVVPLTK